MRVVPGVALVLVLAGCGSSAGTTGPGPDSTEPVDQCSLPVEQRTGGWLCHGEPSPAP